ncbi:MAG: toxin-antitoxin system YwqK family antitoxin [Holosporales bacterium]|jgi:antitoxin component YwqK of YwqJK toxin-antitoxin module|nr:toxin-antitoxin system YwqK family antitoxin [Holosporales bacterium]
MEDDFSGELVQKVDDGRIIINFLNGKKHGLTKFVSNENVTLSEIPYQNDKIHGELKQYYKSGKILSIFTYENGRQNGLFVSFSENGMKQMQANYQNGKLHGEFTAFDEFGDIVRKSVYVDGLKHGECFLYYSKSQGGGIYEVSKYENNLLEGDKTIFYNTGEIMSIIPYKSGKAQAYSHVL